MTASTPVPPADASAVPPELPSKGPAPRAGWAPWKIRALHWTTGLLVVFALGLVALWLVQVQPLRRQVAELEREQESLLAHMDDLQAETARLEGVEAENAALKATTAELERNAALLMARVSTLKAQFIAASGGNAAEALEALARADDQLAILEEALAGTQQEDLRAMRYRLAMAAEEMESDPYAAQRDLEVLANGLATMEQEWLGE